MMVIQFLHLPLYPILVSKVNLKKGSTAHESGFKTRLQRAGCSSETTNILIPHRIGGMPTLFSVGIVSTVKQV